MMWNCFLLVFMMAGPAASPPVAPAADAVAATPLALPKAGVFGAGVNIDLLELGPMQVIGSGGHQSGVLVGVGIELDLGPRAALRLPLRLGGTGESFLQASFSPAFIYRFRHSERQRWVPYVGAGIDLGLFQFGRDILGLDPAPPGIAQQFVRFGVAPQVLLGALYTPARWFALRFEVGDDYFYIAHTSLNAIHETVAVRFAF